MSVYNDKQREEKRKAKLKQEQEATEPKIKNIYDIKTFDELLEYYYVIPKVNNISNNIIKVLEAECIKAKGKTNINLVKRGKRKKRISDEQQELIRNSKKTNEELSKIYNVSASTISNIKNNKY